MINLTTGRGISETLWATLTLMFFIPPAISFGQFEEFSQPPKAENSGISILELSDFSAATSADQTRLPQDDPFAVQPNHQSQSVTVASAPQETQQPIASVPSLDAPELEEPEILLRGPLHEAFADAHQADPQPNPILSATPPEVIKEIPPEFKPEGNNVEWIPGYWAWDVSQNSFIWISGVWRDIPPNQRWVPGYWEEAENGYRWISGFWANNDQQELSYLPTPPANIDLGPSVSAPSDDYFYCPGNWEYQNRTYVWRTGHWQPRVANWIWIPASYIWTPRGCIYRPGYWDREFDVRGTLFAPVHFQQQQYSSDNFCFQPNHCVNTGADFFVHLFVRQNCSHYFYGDWYGQNFVNTGFRPWVQPRSHVRNYDPLLAHYNCSRYRQGSQLLISWVNNQHRHYHQQHNHRPRNTFQAHVNFTQSNHDHRQHDFIHRANLVNRYEDIVRGRADSKSASTHSNVNFKRKYVRTDRHDHDQRDINERLQREIKNTRKLGEQRSKNPGRNNNRQAKDTSNQKHDNDKHDHQSDDDPKTKLIVDQNGKAPRGKTNPPVPNIRDSQKRGNPRDQNLEQPNKIVLPRTQPRQPTNESNRKTNERLTQSQIDKAQRDREKADRKRELEKKIADSKQQAEIKRMQRETARELSELQRKQKLEATRQRIAEEKQTRQLNRNQEPSRTNRRIEEPHARTSEVQNMRTKIEEPQRKQQTQHSNKPSGQGYPNSKSRGTQTPQKQSTRQKADSAKQQRDLAKQQRDAANRAAADRAKQAAQQKIAQSREASRQRDLQRQQEKAVKARADAQKRLDLQSRLAREKSQRDAERRADQQRAQQKAQADAQRRAMEKTQRDAQRKAADQARRAADAARKQQRDQEQAARRAKRKNK